MQSNSEDNLRSGFFLLKGYSEDDSTAGYIVDGDISISLSEKRTENPGRRGKNTVNLTAFLVSNYELLIRGRVVYVS